MRASVWEISRLVVREAAKLAVYRVVFMQVEVARSLSDLPQKSRSFDLMNQMRFEFYMSFEKLPVVVTSARH